MGEHKTRSSTARVCLTDGNVTGQKPPAWATPWWLSTCPRAGA